MYEHRVNTNFQGKKVPKENASYKCLSLIMLDSVFSILCFYIFFLLKIVLYIYFLLSLDNSFLFS